MRDARLQTQSQAHKARWNDVTYLEKFNRQRLQLWFSTTVLIVAAIPAWILYMLLSNWILLEVQLGLVYQEFYYPVRMVVIITLLSVVGLVLIGQGLKILLNSYRYRQSMYELQQEQEKQKKPLIQKSYQQDSWRQIMSSSEQRSRRTTPITPPLDATQRVNNRRGSMGMGMGMGMSTGFEDADSVLRGDMRRRLKFESCNRAEYIEPFSVLPQNQQCVRQFNGQKSTLREPLDCYQQQKFIDKYYPGVSNFVNGAAAAAGESSPPQIVQKVLLRLKLNDRVLQVWTDRLRQWLASQVLKPLVQQISYAHSDANEKAAQLGFNINLPPLDSTFSSPTHQRSQNNQQSGYRTAFLLREQLQHNLNQLQKQNIGPLTTPQNPQEKEKQIKLLEDCILVVTRYFYLCQLLNGQFVKSEMLLGSSSYITQRIKQLASDSCVGAYVWNGGGYFNGQSWNSSLPTDTALIFYILTSFLKAPNWIWPEEDSSQAFVSSSSGPLFLGEIPVRAPERFIGVVANKPGVLSRQSTVMSALLQPRHPQFSLIFEGQEVCTMYGHQGLFQSFLLLLQYVQQKLGGKLGEHSLELYGLKKVIEPVERTYSVWSEKWFGLW